jgi:predicted aldo/keto reductase-like oxidoreductase
MSISRREFLETSAATVGTLAAASAVSADAPVRRLAGPTEQVPLGKTGLKCSLIGIGTGSVGVKRSSNQVKLGQEKFNKLLRYAYERGITYIDAADQYGSHIFVREAIKGLPREKLFIQTKTRATTADVARADIARFLEELGVSYIDSLLMHCMTKGTWPSDFRPVMDVLTEAKARGVVRAVGVSCHGMDPLRTAARTDWIDIDLARINPVGVPARMDGPPEDVVPNLRAMHERGKGILGMKILGEGTFKTQEQQLASLKFVLGLGCVDAFVIGFESPEQIDGLLKVAEQAIKG